MIDNPYRTDFESWYFSEHPRDSHTDWWNESAERYVSKIVQSAFEAWCAALEFDRAKLPHWLPGAKFSLGDSVTKIRGAHWSGPIVGFYSTKLTPIGYAIESRLEVGSVQIFPEAALDMFEAKGGLK